MLNHYAKLEYLDQTESPVTWKDCKGYIHTHINLNWYYLLLNQHSQVDD